MESAGNHSANEGDENGGGNVHPLPGIQRRPGKPPGHPKPEGSGRKKGVPNKTTREIRAVAQKHGPKAIRKLVALLASENEATAIKAAVELLDRGYGRPVTPQEISGPDGGPMQTENVAEYTPAERAEAWRGLLGVLAPPAAPPKPLLTAAERAHRAEAWRGVLDTPEGEDAPVRAALEGGE